MHYKLKSTVQKLMIYYWVTDKLSLMREEGRWVSALGDKTQKWAKGTDQA